jgi:hypothetical protein
MTALVMIVATIAVPLDKMMTIFAFNLTPQTSNKMRRWEAPQQLEARNP